jgi:glycosyltransferase involved in cell wall biosynthesis
VVPGIAEAQAALGHEVILWASVGVEEKYSSRFFSIRIVGGKLSDVFDLIGQPDIVHDHCVWNPYTHRLASYCRARGIYRVVSTHGMLEPWSLAQKKWRKRLAWWAYQRRDLDEARALHATADSEEGQLRKLGFKQRIINLPNGIDLSFKSMISGKQLPESDADGRRTVLFLSRIHPKKGIPLLIQAWERVKPDGWRMLVVGPGEQDYIDYLRGLVESADVAGDWTFRNAVEDEGKWEIFSSASLFVLPTYSENFGIVVAEALSAGVPVITTKGAPWSGLRENSCGWWVDANTDDIAAALREATALPVKELKDMGNRGRAWAMRKFSWPTIAEAMVDEYAKLLGD